VSCFVMTLVELKATTRLVACSVSLFAFTWLTRPRGNLESFNPAFIEIAADVHNCYAGLGFHCY
jgi:hypothetical protein